MPALDLGKLGEWDVRLFGIRQRDPDREIGDRQRIAKNIFAAAQVIVEHTGELLEESGRFLDSRMVLFAEAEFRLDQVFEIKLAGVTRKMLRIPGQPARQLDLTALVARPKIRSCLLREVTHDRIGFP